MKHDFLFHVSDIKQYFYCPRVLYFTYVRPMPKQATFKMEMGKEEHEVIEELEKRRLLKRYGLEDGKREFHLQLKSERLGINGKLDLLIRSSRGLFPVEFKFSSRKPATNHKYQLAAYALLVEERFNQPVRQGFLYFQPSKSIYPVLFSQGVKDFTKRTLQRMLDLIYSEQVPPLPRRGRCVDCEFRNYCGGA